MTRILQNITLKLNQHIYDLPPARDRAGASVRSYGVIRAKDVSLFCVFVFCFYRIQFEFHGKDTRV